MIDIVQKLQLLMHFKSAAIAPRTTGEIEILREAQNEILKLRKDLLFAPVSGYESDGSNEEDD